MVVCIYVELATKRLKNNVPFQAVSNKLAVELLPNGFRDLRRLERVLVAKRILFKKSHSYAERSVAKSEG